MRLSSCMKRFFLYFIFAAMAISALAQSIGDDPAYRALMVRQSALKSSQDSLQSLLSSARASFEDASDKQRETISQTIVRLEGEIYDMRSKMSRIGSDIAAIEQQYAERSLQSEALKPAPESAVLYDNLFFKDNLASGDIAKLRSVPGIETKVRQIVSSIEPLYARLVEIKMMYDRSILQSEVDALKNEAEGIVVKIEALDKQIGELWLPVYNFSLDTYLVLLDKVGAQDRTMLESLENEWRDVRRTEAFAVENSMAPNLAAFDVERALLVSYQKALAKVLDLTVAYNVLTSSKVMPVSKDMPIIKFLPRVLTIYSPIQTGIKYLSDNPNDLPEAIIPATGNYYSVQISLLSAMPSSLDMFKGAFPLQYLKTADGKFRFMAGGFHTYAEAAKGLSVLTKAGYRAPVIVAFRDGDWISPLKAKAYDATKTAVASTDGASYRIDVMTKDPSVAEKLRGVVDMHAKGKSISRIAEGDSLHFTIMQFASKEEAEVIAQIIRERVEANVTVDKIEN